MSKKLAIKGHPTRGKEVIELLEMMGGISWMKNLGNRVDRLYYIHESKIISYDDISLELIGIYKIFTLEEFLEKYPFKVGDKAVYIDDNDIVVISEIEWDNTVEDIFYKVKRIDEDDCFLCPPEVLKPYKEEVNMKDKEDKLFDSIIWHLRNSINNGKQDISGGDCERYFRELVDKVKETNMNENKFGTAKEPLETKSNAVKFVDGKVIDNFRKEFCELCGSQRCSGQGDELVYCERFKNLMDNSGKPSVKNHKMGPKSKLPSKYYEDRMEEIKSKREYDELRMPLDNDDKLATEATIMGKKILPPDGYLVGKITETDNGMLVEYVEKKPKYPNDYKTCCDALYVNSNHNECYEACLRGYPMETFARLLICRDAYWKIAGEQMGLDKDWEPKWCNEDKLKYCIECSYGTIDKTVESVWNCILSFPTEEMRDAFYENFKDLIEQCKKFL